MKFVAVVFALFAITSCTPKPETKVVDAVENEVGGEKAVADFLKSLDQLYGKNPSKFKTSVAEFYKDRLKVKATDVKVEDAKASASVNITVPERKTMQGLLFMTALMDQKILREMTLDDLVQKLGKELKPPATSSRDIKDETIQQAVTLLKEGETWKIQPESIKKLAAAMNKIN